MPKTVQQAESADPDSEAQPLQGNPGKIGTRKILMNV